MGVFGDRSFADVVTNDIAALVAGYTARAVVVTFK
jgi:hypothetical protein